MSQGTFILGICLFAAGIFIGRVKMRPQIASGGDSPPEKDKVEISATPLFTSLEEAIRLSPEMVLEDLARAPYLKLTDSEVKALAERIDIRKESHRRLVNQVMPPDFSEALWIAVLRANVGKMPLKELLELSRKAWMGSTKFELPLMEAIHDSPDRKEILTSEWGKRYLMSYLDHISGKIPDLKETMELLPVGEVAPEMREELLNSWLHARPTCANLEAILNLPADNMRGMYVRENAAIRVWKASPDERPEIISKLAGLPGPQRNRLLRSLTYVIPPDDPASMASVISHFTSFEYQRQLTEKWLDDDGSNAGSKKIINSERKEKLLDELDALKNTTSVRKLRAELAE